MSYKQYPERRATILENWHHRLAGCERKIDTWQDVLRVRSLVLSPLDNVDSWIKFSSLCRRNGRNDLSHKTMTNLLGVNTHGNHINPLTITNSNSKVVFGYIKHLWDAGHCKLAFDYLRR